MIKQLKLFWKRVTQEVYEQDINYYEIKECIENEFPRCKIEITDIRKKCCSYKTLKGIANLIPVRYNKYKKEVFDCEDFAIIAWGVWKAMFPRLPIGLVFAYRGGQKHALNFALYKTKSGRVQWAFIEPQNGKVFCGKYRPYNIII